jgi:hypothetical protein
MKLEIHQGEDNLKKVEKMALTTKRQLLKGVHP